MSVRGYVHLTDTFYITPLRSGNIEFGRKVRWLVRKWLVSCDRLVLPVWRMKSIRPRRAGWFVVFDAWTVEFDVLKLLPILFCLLIFNLYILLLLYVLIIAAVNRTNENEKYNNPKGDKAYDVPNTIFGPVIAWVVRVRWRIKRGDWSSWIWELTWG